MVYSPHFPPAPLNWSGPLTDDAVSFVNTVTEAVRPLHRSYTEALWEAATTGKDEANTREKQAQAKLMRFWADPERFARAEALDEGGHEDPLVDRSLRAIYLSAAKAQQDEEIIEQLTELEAEVRSAYYNYRAEIDGERLSDNELVEILSESTNSDEVERAWQASKEVGTQVADRVRDLARTRNRAARSAGYRDHFEKALLLNEIDEEELFTLLSDLDEMTAPLFRELKAQIDRDRAQRFGVAVDELGPWHYGDRFFQEAPEMADGGLETAFKGSDPVALARKTYGGWGLQVDDILERSDLYAREGKNQHAFCLDIDREGDIRTLNNLEPNYRWVSTLHHELGHAVYDKYIDRSLPWMLRTPSHTLSTEAMALLAETVFWEPDWISQALGTSPAEAENLASQAAERDRAGGLVFTRWVLVMTNFERALYADPEQDLDSLWWSLKDRYQRLRKPPGRKAPDWAAKYHVALAPVYYQNYELGHLFMAQVRQKLSEEVGAFVGDHEVGAWLESKLFAPGAREPWSAHVVSATGQPLDPHAFVSGLKAASP